MLDLFGCCDSTVRPLSWGDAPKARTGRGVTPDSAVLVGVAKAERFLAALPEHLNDMLTLALAKCLRLSNIGLLLLPWTLRWQMWPRNIPLCSVICRSPNRA